MSTLDIDKAEVKGLRAEFDIVDRCGWGIVVLESLKKAIAKNYLVTSLFNYILSHLK